MNRKNTRIILLLSAIVLYTKPSLAYIDPASGSLLLQFILGGLAALGVVVKLLWNKTTRLFKKEQNKVDG